MSLIFATIPSKRLAQGITSSSSSFYVNNIIGFNTTDSLDVDDTDLGTQHYVVFRNDTGTKIEIMEIDPTTISTGPITIVRRGLSYYGDRTTEVTANKLDWSANETIVNFGTDAPQLFQYLKEYIDAASIAGAVDASTTAKGIVEEATQAEADAGTTTGGTGAKLFVPLDKRRGKLINDYAADSVGTDSYAITISPAITAYATGQRFTFKAGTANTGACTLNVSGLGAKTIKKNVSTDLATGDILANQIVEVEYDGTNMQLLSVKKADLTTDVYGILPVANGGTGVSTSVTYSSVVSTGIQASGAVSYAHGLGVTPKRIKVTCFSRSTSNSNSGVHSTSVGTYDGTNTMSIYNYGDSGNSFAPTSSTTVIATENVTDRTATATFNATNVILTWSGATDAGTALLIESWAF